MGLLSSIVHRLGGVLRPEREGGAAILLVGDGARSAVSLADRYASTVRGELTEPGAVGPGAAARAAFHTAV